jgi:flap endonuclease-1
VGEVGVTALRDLAVIKNTSLDAYHGDTVAVDAHHWLFLYITVQVRYVSENNYITDDGTEVPNLVGLLRGLPTLLNRGVTPVFVFDGAPDEMKYDEIAKRREAKEDAKERMKTAREAGNTQDARRYKARTQSLTPVVQETSRRLLDLLGVPYAEADGAGEGYAARLATEHPNVSAVFTGDYDALLFGSPETVRKWSGKGDAEQIQLTKTLDSLNLTHDQLIDAAILIGTDYNDGVHGIGPKRAVKYLRNGRTVEDILADRNADIPGLDNVRELFRTPPTGELVTTTTATDPDFTEAERYLVEDWDIPRDTVVENLERFDSY